MTVKLVDGEHKFLSCCSCKRKLVDIWVTLPDADLVWYVTATCPYCGDRSKTEEIHGKFHRAPYCQELNDDEIRQITKIEDEEIDFDTGVVLFKVVKA